MLFHSSIEAILTFPSSSVGERLCGSLATLGVLLGDVLDLELRREGLLELLGLVGVLKDKGVEVALAANLELDLGALAAALDASGGSVLSPGNLNELLDITDFARHLGGIWGGFGDNGGGLVWSDPCNFHYTNHIST